MTDSDDENDVEGLPWDHELISTILANPDIQLGLLNIYSLLGELCDSLEMSVDACLSICSVLEHCRQSEEPESLAGKSRNEGHFATDIQYRYRFWVIVLIESLYLFLWESSRWLLHLDGVEFDIDHVQLYSAISVPADAIMGKCRWRLEEVNLILSNSLTLAILLDTFQKLLFYCYN